MRGAAVAAALVGAALVLSGSTEFGEVTAIVDVVKP